MKLRSISLCLVVVFAFSPVGISKSITVDLSSIGWLASVNDDNQVGTSQNHANIISGTDAHGDYYGMEWRSPQPTDLSLLEINVANTIGIEEIVIIMSSSESMDAGIWLSASDDSCTEGRRNASRRIPFAVDTTPKAYTLTLADFVADTNQACSEGIQSDAWDRACSLVLFPSSLGGELRIYALEFRGPSVSTSTCSSVELENVLQNGSFEKPTISQAIAQGAEGEPGEAAWALDVSDWEESGEPGYCRLFATDGTQCFYWNDPIEAWLEQTVRWEELQANLGDQIEMEFWNRINLSDGAQAAGKMLEFGAELLVGDQVVDTLTLSGESDPMLFRLTATVLDQHVGKAVTVRFWAAGNKGWSGPDEVQSIYLDRVTLGVAGSYKPLRAFGMCSPLPEPLSGVDVTVRFPSPDYHMVFDPPQGGFYYVNETYAFGNEWAETNARGDCYEVGFDRSARMWIEHASPARVVVGFRGALMNDRGQIAHTDRNSGSPYGRGDWADEWYYIYPDGTSARHVRIYTGYAEGASSFWWPGVSAGFETQETFIRGIVQGHQPTDDISVHAITLAQMDGRYRQFSFSPYPEEQDMYPGANIQIVNVLDSYKPFTIVPEGNTNIMPYWGPLIDQANLATTTFVTWPRVPYFENGYTSALTHVINRSWHRQTANTLEQIYLLGLTNAPEEADRVAELVQLARSWQYAPDAVVAGTGYEVDGYRIEEKAYHIAKLETEPTQLKIEFGASDERPLVNPCIVIHGWLEADLFQAYVDDVLLQADTEYAYGFEEQEDGGTSLILWVELESTSQTSLTIRPRI